MYGGDPRERVLPYLFENLTCCQLCVGDACHPLGARAQRRASRLRDRGERLDERSCLYGSGAGHHRNASQPLPLEDVADLGVCRGVGGVDAEAHSASSTPSPGSAAAARSSAASVASNQRSPSTMYSGAFHPLSPEAI